MEWEEYQEKAIEEFQKHTKELTDICCPECGKFIYRRTDIVLTSFPPKYYYQCDCGWKGCGY